jgi:DNA-binding Lrp family transcriptional regulator
VNTSGTKPIFVRIKCELGMTYKVADVIMDTIEETGGIYSTSGTYDLLVQFNVPVSESIGRFVNERLHKIAGIRDTETLIVFNVFGRLAKDVVWTEEDRF